MYWLLKSEPDVYSIDELARARRGPWEGVRNYQARNHLRAMKKGELGFFYHSSCEPPGIAGLLRIRREAYPDATQFDPRASTTIPSRSRAIRAGRWWTWSSSRSSANSSRCSS